MPNDELTGLLSRAQFFEKLQSALGTASQKKHPLALVYVDLDHLLRINDTYGHWVGDDAIRLVASALSQYFSGEAFTGRIGGDEFVTALPNADPQQIAAQVEQLRASVQAQLLHIEKDGQPIELTVTLSAGIAFYESGASAGIDDLIRKAYEALLGAKETNGNAVRIYSEAEEKDSLTGVLKRYGLMVQFDKARTAAESTHGNVAIISLDVDDFESINRQYGRFAGDEVLRRIAATLSSNFKEIGTVGRFSGDEFVVVLPESRAETAFVLAEEVRKVVEDTPIHLQVGEQKTHLTIHISGGVAEFPSDGSEWKDLFRKADEALYRAKRQGRNRICLPVSTQMVTKTSHFTQTQLEKLADLAKRTGKSEAYLLREGLDELLKKYE